MPHPMMNTGTTGKGMHFLLAPEDSSGSPSGVPAAHGRACWNATKTVLWIVFSILAALLIGQL
jgi:hypothetical protein